MASSNGGATLERNAVGLTAGRTDRFRRSANRLTVRFVGNVYRILVTNQDGVPITARATDKVSVVLRGPGSLAAATIERFTVAGGWQPLSSNDAGFGSTFLAVVTEFGDFALVVAGPGPTVSPAASRTAPSIGPPAPSLATSAGPPGSGLVAAAQPVAPMGSTGGSEIELVGVVAIVIVGLGGLVAWRARLARRSARYRGAHPRETTLTARVPIAHADWPRRAQHGPRRSGCRPVRNHDVAIV